MRPAAPFRGAGNTETTRITVAQLNDVDFAHLVDTAVIQAAIDRLVAAVERLRLAGIAYDTAAVAHEAAKVASDRAAAGKGDVTPEDAEVEIEAASRAMRIAAKVLEASKRERESAHAGILPERGKAHRQVYLAGVTIRLAAAKKADLARALLVEAQADFAKGSGYLAKATENGCPPLFGNPGPSDLLRTYVEEAKMWASHNDFDGHPFKIPQA
jgi:hypothetical protein